MDLLENEQIKDIENYEGLYAVTTKEKEWSFQKALFWDFKFLCFI